MGLIEIASNKSFWRGVDYYNQKKVLSWKKTDDGVYEGVVSGSENKKYEVSVDVAHPRRSKCSCPFAADGRVICKHMLALFFTAEPKVLERSLEDIEKYEQELEEEEERRLIEHEQALMKKARSMSKSDLIEELVLAWLRIEELQSNRFYYD